MAVSLEVRCPILDHVFMEYAAKIPYNLKLKGLEGKHIFKKALKKYLPDDILYRKKMGFGVPILEWMKGDLKEYTRSLVLDGEASKTYLNGSQLEKIWNEVSGQMYQQAAGAQGGPQPGAEADPSQAGAEGTDDKNVEEADFEVVDDDKKE